MFIEFDCTDEDGFRKLITDYTKGGDLEILSIVENGPAGGNPLYRITIYSAEAHRWFVEAYYGDEGKEPADPGKGWDLFDYDGLGLLHIERVDEAAIFESDTAAIAHVRDMAVAGDPEAIEAIIVHDVNQPFIDEIVRIEAKRQRGLRHARAA